MILVVVDAMIRGVKCFDKIFGKIQDGLHESCVQEILGHFHVSTKNVDAVIYRMVKFFRVFCDSSLFVDFPTKRQMVNT